MCAARRSTSLQLATKVQRMGPFGRMPRPEIYWLRPEQIHPVVRIAHRQAAGLSIPERIIFDYELVLIVRGRGHWEIDGERHTFGPNELLLVPPFTPHSFDSGGELSEHLAVHFDFAEGVPGSKGNLDRRRPYRVKFTQGLSLKRQRKLVSGHKLARALSGIVATHAEGRVLAAATASVQLAGVLLALLAEESAGASGGRKTQDRDQGRVEAVLKFMGANLAKPINQRMLERISGLSSSRLQALFREVTGYPPLDCLRRLRVEEARALLADPQWSVKQVAARTGFRDTSHFSKVFRRIDGLSPAHYRDALLAGRQEE